jgi:arylsulfatase A-like enzyme
LISLFSALSALTALVPEPPAAKYNLLLISIDTLRADHLKCYGYDKDTAPCLDELAKEGVLFEDLTAASPWTVPSHMSMFTSLYPSVHGVQDVNSQLGDAVGTLAQCLAQSGYMTMAFVAGPILARRYGFDRGFLYYDDFTAEMKRRGIARRVRNPEIANLAMEWLKNHASETFFLFVHYFDCHFPYEPPGSLAKRFAGEHMVEESSCGITRPPDYVNGTMSAYDGVIAYTDDHVGKILNLLQELGLSDKTLVIVLSDHGEGFFEHGTVEHGNSVYEELLHVPLIMRLPGVVPAGRRIGGNISHVDLMPTVLGLLGVAGPSHMQGIDLSPVIRGGQPVPERLIYSELAAWGFKLRAVRWGDRKLIGTTGTLDGAQLEELVGGREKVIAGADLKRDCPAAALDGLTMGPSSPLKAIAGKTEEPDAETIRLLKSLGYAQ